MIRYKNNYWPQNLNFDDHVLWYQEKNPNSTKQEQLTFAHSQIEIEIVLTEQRVHHLNDFVKTLNKAIATAKKDLAEKLTKTES